MKLILVLVLSIVAANAQLDPALLSDPIYQPFIQIVLDKAAVCIADPAVTGGKFAVSSCPGLVSIMTDIYNKVPEPAVTCQPECVAIFDTLNDACDEALRAAFTTGTGPIETSGKAFFDACDKVGPATSPSVSPAAASPSPDTASPSPDTASPSPATASPSPATPSASPSPVPSPTPVPSSAGKTIPQLVFALVGAAVLLA